MKSRALRTILVGLSIGLGVLGCAGGTPSVDLGDGSSGNLLWGVIHYTYENKDLDKALFYADKALELHGAEARRLQASLSDFPATDPPEVAYEYNALNNVAMATLVKGDVLSGRGDRAGAAEVYSMVIQEFGYAQVQDLGEWQGDVPSVPRDAQGFLKLADVAKQKLADLEEGRD